VSYEYFIDPKGRISGLIPGSPRYMKAIEKGWPTATKAGKKYVHKTYKATGVIPSQGLTAEFMAAPASVQEASLATLATMGIGVGAGSLVGLGTAIAVEHLVGEDMSQIVAPGLDWLRDILDVAIPEEILGLELGGVTAGGAKIYNGVWIEGGKVRYSAPGGKARVLGYTPGFAKKKYRVKRRSKRLTKRDMYFGEIARSNPSTAMGIIQQMI